MFLSESGPSFMPYVFCSGYYYYYCYYILSLNAGSLDPNAYCRGELEVNKKLAFIQTILVI